jgi:tRNA-dihydrouridine synthase B
MDLKNKKNKNKASFWFKLAKNKPILALAPMAGITDSAFRQLCLKYGADVVYTEMVSANALHYNSEKTLKLLKFSKTEKPIVVQLFGKDPEKFIKATQMVTKMGFDGIDINFGCPARKVAGHGGGVTLMRNLELCYEIIKNVCDHTPLPVSIKTRTSINLKTKETRNRKTKVTVLDLIQKIENLPITTIMVHGRTYEKPFVGEIDYEMVRKVKESFPGIVLANGNLTNPKIAQKTLELTNADGLGLARGLYGRSWLFEDIKEYLKKGKYKEKTWEDIKRIALEHAKLNYKIKGDFGIIEMRKHLIFYSKRQKQAKEMRKNLVQVENINQIKKVFQKY